MTTTVIIPVHNRPVLVTRAIASLQAQTLAVNEILVIDDASTDDTRAVVLAMADEDPRIRLIALDKNGGASAARNIGLQKTQCDWVAFLDSDDGWMPDKHELQSRALAASPEAIGCFTGIRYQFGDHYKDESPPAQVTLAMVRGINYLGSTSTAMIRRATLISVGGFDAALPSCQDWDLWLKLGRIGPFQVIQKPLVSYSQADPKRISKNSIAVLAGHETVFALALADVTDPKEIRRIKASHQMRLAQIFLWDFDSPGRAIAAALRSLAIRPTRYGCSLLGWSLLSSLRSNGPKMRSADRF
jgi:hypothetical protein